MKTGLTKRFGFTPQKTRNSKMVGMVLIASLLGLGGCATNSGYDGINGYIGPEIAKDPYYNEGVSGSWNGPLNGPVSKMVHYECKEDCSEVWKRKTVAFDRLGRVTQVEDDDSKAIYSYEGQSLLPSSREGYFMYGSRTQPTIENYERDEYGNIIAKNGEPFLDISIVGGNIVAKPANIKEGNGYTAYIFNDGELIRKESFGAMGISMQNAKASVVKIPYSHQRYDYKYHPDGKLARKDEYAYQDKKLTSHMWEIYYTDGLIGLSGLEYPDRTDRYLNGFIGYKKDEYGNWTQRQRCKILSEWGDFGDCQMEQRKFEYFES